MSLTYCQRRKAYYICVLHLHKGLVELLSVMSVCATPHRPQDPSCGVCVAGMEGIPITRRGCPLPSHLTKEDHNECLRARVPQGWLWHSPGDSGDRAVSDSTSTGAEWTHAQGNPLGPLALPLNHTHTNTFPHITAASMSQGVRELPPHLSPQKQQKGIPFLLLMGMSNLPYSCPLENQP